MARTDPGEALYADLTAALDTYRTPCADVPVFTAEREDVTTEALAWAIRQCQSCAVVEMCRAYAETSNPKSGIWAGREYPRRGKSTT